MREAIVLVHGIWMVGLDLIPLRQRLRGAGYEPRIFRYPSLTQTPAQNAALLSNFLPTVEADVVHFVGHSLGGVGLLHLFETYEVPRPGRVVLLGSPVSGSSVADLLSTHALSRPFLGRSGERGLLGGGPRWGHRRELGTIAGDRSLGIGRVLRVIGGPSDGTVSVAETHLEGAVDHVTLPATHLGLVFSAGVFKQTEHFLRHGHFAAKEVADERAQ